VYRADENRAQQRGGRRQDDKCEGGGKRGMRTSSLAQRAVRAVRPRHSTNLGDLLRRHLIHIGNPAPGHKPSVIGMPEVMVVHPNGMNRPDGSTIGRWTYRPAREATRAQFERCRGSAASAEPGFHDAESRLFRQPHRYPLYVRLCDLVPAHVPEGAKVLDWGAGNGHLSFLLAQSGYDATGYSLFPQEFPAWLKEPAYELVVGDPSDPVALPFADESFDAVFSCGVLEHVRETGGDEVASLRKIHRVLQPGGVFIAYHFANRYSWIETSWRESFPASSITRTGTCEETSCGW
jgi:hypothetical protein